MTTFTHRGGEFMRTPTPPPPAWELEMRRLRAIPELLDLQIQVDLIAAAQGMVEESVHPPDEYDYFEDVQVWYVTRRNPDRSVRGSGFQRRDAYLDVAEKILKKEWRWTTVSARGRN